MAEENMEKDMDQAAEDTKQKATDENTPKEAPDEEKAAQASEKNAEDQKTDAGKTEKETKDKKDIQIEELNDRVKRQMAEFENFRKRSEKEKAGMFEMGAKSVIEHILPIVDNFERGLSAVSEEAKADPFVDGMNKVYKQMVEMLEKLDVKAIDAMGKQFDPEFHNAVMHVEDEEADDNVIVEEFLKGYTYKNQVVRHSMVKVAN